MCDRDALVELFAKTAGTKWHNNTNWNSDERYGLWYGVQVDVGGHVAKINLYDNFLEGYIPTGSVMRYLFNLQSLDLSRNMLGGTIPDSIGTLTSLEELSLAWNELNGPIPACLYNLNKLRVLRLDNNQLTGTLSDNLANLRELRLLNISRNYLTGHIPAVAIQLVHLQVIDFTGNKFEGTIPSTVRQYREVESITQAIAQIHRLRCTQQGATNSRLSLLLENTTMEVYTAVRDRLMVDSSSAAVSAALDRLSLVNGAMWLMERYTREHDCVLGAIRAMHEEHNQRVERVNIKLQFTELKSGTLLPMNRYTCVSTDVSYMLGCNPVVTEGGAQLPVVVYEVCMADDLRSLHSQCGAYFIHPGVKVVVCFLLVPPTQTGTKVTEMFYVEYRASDRRVSDPIKARRVVSFGSQLTAATYKAVLQATGVDKRDFTGVGSPGEQCTKPFQYSYLMRISLQQLQYTAQEVESMTGGNKCDQEHRPLIVIEAKVTTAEAAEILQQHYTLKASADRATREFLSALSECERTEGLVESAQAELSDATTPSEVKATERVLGEAKTLRADAIGAKQQREGERKSVVDELSRLELSRMLSLGGDLFLDLYAVQQSLATG